MAFVSLSRRIVALMVRLMLLRCARMSYACREMVAALPFRKRYDTCAFQISSFVFMSRLAYPRRLFMLRFVENPTPLSMLRL